MRKKPATKAAAKTTAKPAVKETAAEVKNTVIETAAEKTEEVVKSEEKKVAEAVETVKEATETVKEAAKKVTEKAGTAAKTVAKKATAEKKTAAKKEEVKPEVFVQFQGQEAVIEEVVEKAKKQFVEEGHRASSIKSIQVYLKPEEFEAYYVINQKHAGRVNLF